MEAVHRYEGTVNQVMGDGIMALFGAPVAHEDHGVRACYAISAWTVPPPQTRWRFSSATCVLETRLDLTPRSEPRQATKVVMAGITVLGGSSISQWPTTGITRPSLSGSP
jgi:class 3 adenylate cyclase